MLSSFYSPTIFQSKTSLCAQVLEVLSLCSLSFTFDLFSLILYFQAVGNERAKALLLKGQMLTR